MEQTADHKQFFEIMDLFEEDSGDDEEEFLGFERSPSPSWTSNASFNTLQDPHHQLHIDDNGDISDIELSTTLDSQELLSPFNSQPSTTITTIAVSKPAEDQQFYLDVDGTDISDNELSAFLDSQKPCNPSTSRKRGNSVAALSIPPLRKCNRSSSTPRRHLSTTPSRADSLLLCRSNSSQITTPPTVTSRKAPIIQDFKSLKDFGKQADLRKTELQVALSSMLQKGLDDVNILLSEVRKLHALLGSKNYQLQIQGEEMRALQREKEAAVKENQILKEKLQDLQFMKH